MFLDFDKKDCTQCQQYSLLIEIKEARIDKLNNDLKDEIAKSRLEFDELKRNAAQKDNDLAKYKKTIETLKTELNALRIKNDIEKVTLNNEQMENIGKAALILHEKSVEKTKLQE